MCGTLIRMNLELVSSFKIGFNCYIGYHVTFSRVLIGYIVDEGGAGAMRGEIRVTI